MLNFHVKHNPMVCGALFSIFHNITAGNPKFFLNRFLQSFIMANKTGAGFVTTHQYYPPPNPFFSLQV